MIKNIIIGKNSFLTKSNLKFLKNCSVYSANELNTKKLKDEVKKSKKINIIFNNFFSSKFLNELNYNDYKKFCNLSLEKIIDVLENVQQSKINKIIYTSSSSIYRLADDISNEKPDKLNRQLYSSFKLAAEKLIMNYANNNNKNYFIMRLFNTYGDENDKFSFVEKIIRARKNDKKIKLINDGMSLRDFIHLDDVGKIYKLFLNKKITNGVYDIGTGKGVLIKDLVKISEIRKTKITRVNKIEEIQNSIANTKKLLIQIPNYKFKKVTKYIQKRLNIKKNFETKSITYQNTSINKIVGVAIYGAGFAGKQIYKALKKNNENIAFFIDDNIKLQNSIHKGIPIISYEEVLKNKLNLQIKRIYLTIPSLNKESLNIIIKKLKKDFIDVRYLPEKKFLLSDRIDLNDLNIDVVNEILKRKQVKIKRINKLSNKSILVTGAGGTIGSEICRQLLQQKVKKVIAIDKSEISIYNLQKRISDKKIIYKLININNSFQLEKIIKKEKIDFLFHAAAYKHVNILEQNLSSAIINNILATYKICKLSTMYSFKMVFISTDKAANPKSVLGYTKRVAEKTCEYFNEFLKNKDFINIVRFGNVFGSSGSAITNFLEQINLDKDVKITHKDASRYFMTISEACHLVLQTTEMKSKNKIFVLDMGKPLNILNLAKNLGEIKSRINPNYNFKYKIIGLQPGEKLHETIFDSREVKSKANNEIFLVKSKIKMKNDFIKYYEKFYTLLKKENEKNLLNHLMKIKNL